MAAATNIVHQGWRIALLRILVKFVVERAAIKLSMACLLIPVPKVLPPNTAGDRTIDKALSDAQRLTDLPLSNAFAPGAHSTATRRTIHRRLPSRKERR
ncbi:MAG TPA: hypothetical protein VHD36_08825 [Pirellulales bacterium]|nr:hypothetical protein [Pirellulales bacterium]